MNESYDDRELAELRKRVDAIDEQILILLVNVGYVWLVCSGRDCVRWLVQDALVVHTLGWVVFLRSTCQVNSWAGRWGTMLGWFDYLYPWRCAIEILWGDKRKPPVERITPGADKEII